MSTRDDDADGAGSRSGASSSAGGSQTSSQRSDSKFLKLRDRAAAEREEGDLLEQKRSIQDGIFQCMYTLVRSSALGNWKFALLKIILEGLMVGPECQSRGTCLGFIVVFNPSVTSWRIYTNNPVWQVIRWTVWRSPIMRIYGYDTYILVLYIMVVAVFLSVAGLVWLTLAMRKQEQSKWLKRAATVLHVVYDLIFMMFYVSFFDYFVFTANCNFAGDKTHVYFDGVYCLRMPHILHMAVAVVTAAVFFCVTALLVVASSDLNPVSRGYLASPAAMTRLKILTAKALFVIASDDMQSWPKPQAIIIIWAVAMICWWNFRRLPFYRQTVNIVWCSMWMGVLYTAVLLAAIVFSGNHSDQYKRDMTLNVLYGIFPVIGGGIVICWAHAWWATRPAKLFKGLEPGVKISKVYKLADFNEVEILSRVMRKFDTDDGVDDEAGALGETIIKAGMQLFPTDPFLLILYANFLLEVRKDGPAARTQLQLALKHMPTLVQRYQIFCTGEASKRLKDSQDGGMDLQAYIEFRRNFRAVLRVHKEVMLLQADLWTLMMKSTVKVTEVDKALDALETGAVRAHQVYKRVLERYPTNGKLLRVYGKFLEDVKHDPIAATRAYNEASRNGGGDAIMNLDLSAVQGSADKPDFLTSMSMEDDAVIVINAEGTIMMVSQAVQKVFGYPKTELEGANVALLMPQPFSQRHPSYLTRYVNGGEPHILDTVREVVALHKERYVFPMQLCVTKMSGTGSDSVFLGVARPLASNLLNVRAWVAPNGVFLCGDNMFASMCGVAENELVGRSLAALLDNDQVEVERLLERCRDAAAAELEAGVIKAQLLLRHKYLDPIPVDVTFGLAGTDGQRIYVLNCHRTDGQDGNIMVVDQHLRLRFCSVGISMLLGFPLRKLATMKLDQLLPPPYNTMHGKWIKENGTASNQVPPTSCRAGKVVHLLNENNSAVPVKIKIRTVTADDGVSTQHVVSVEKAPTEEIYDEKRLEVITDFNGRVLSVARPEATVFDFAAGDLVGTSLCDTVDIFTEWRERNGESQLQLLILALLDKEQEMPGTSWRVRVQPPPSAAVPHLPAIAGAVGGAKKGPNAKSACLQVELEESDDNAAAGGSEGGKGGEDTETRIKVTLWRRDLLSGVVDLDEGLVIRKASYMTGLIVGMPAAAMVKKPIQRFLDIPHDITWDKLVESNSKGHNRKKGALKTNNNRGTISPAMAFIGPHPDTGTMRIITQGVSMLAPGGRPKITVTMHPDTTFAGAHANLMRVLHLDGTNHTGVDSTHPHSAVGGGHGTAAAGMHGAAAGADAHAHGAAAAGAFAAGTTAAAGAPAAAPAAAGAAHGGAGDRSGRLRSSPDAAMSDGAHDDAAGEHEGTDDDHHSEPRSRSDDDASDSDHSKGRKDGSEDLEAKGQAKLHSRAASKSDFVAQWVRTLTNKNSGALEAHQPQPQQPMDHRSSTGLEGHVPAMPPGMAGGAAGGGPLAPIPEHGAASGGYGDAPTQMSTKASKSFARAMSDSRQGSPQEGASRARGGAADGGDRDKGGKEKGEDWEKGSEGGESSQSGSQAASGITGITDATSVSELQIDSRRGRLLKALTKLLCGPMLMEPLERLRLHSYCIMLFMLVTHVICYVIVQREIGMEHHDINLVARQALAMDRSQLIAVRAMMGAYCERPNITEKVSVCANSLNFTLGKLKENIALMESHHQFVYLGDKKDTTVRLMPVVYDIWTSEKKPFVTYLDTHPPKTIDEKAAVWVMGARYISAAREALYWLPTIRENYRLHRTFNFLIANGLGPLFEAYARSLDHLVNAAWQSVDELKQSLVVMMVIEGLFIQVACLIYEWVLVHSLEHARLTAVLAMVGLPGPVLRQLASRDAKILDGSDDEDDDSDSDGEEEQQQQQRQSEPGGGGGGGAAGERPGSGGASAAKGVRHADSGGEQGDASGGGGPGGGGLAAVRKAMMTRKQLDLDGSGAAEQGADERGVKDSAGGDEGAVGAAAGGRAEGGKPAALMKTSAGGGVRDDGDANNQSDVDSSDDGTRGGGGGGGDGRGGRKNRGPVAVTKFRQARQTGFCINGKTLVPSIINVTKFVAPVILWNITVVLIYVVSLLQLNSMQGPLASLNMASHIIYRYTRVRAIAFGFVSQDDFESREVWREMLKQEMTYFESEYDALMYGGTPITQQNSVFNHPVPASTFASASFANEFFRAKRCFRYDQSACFKEGHQYYEVTHNGLDVMVRRMMAEMTLLSEDADQDVRYNGTRYMFMAGVGGNDLYEGLQQAAQLFVDYSIGRYNQVADLHMILLIVTIFGAIVYIAFILWPHLARLKADASRQSALLSHVPPEMDVRAHVKAVFRRSARRRKGLLRFGGGKGGGGGGGGSSAAPSSALILPTAGA
ncbi:hypothetical protein HYH02_009297 [Chlamydomonas schloesseri]|uniref:PAS domain-containing protein n=1 Tax=Chlamydomonas schloesseri TaxID=2026947 RepID=A0A835TM70_9CHLO|nr:hypothetical protein HYH02_009297 [Chlamydomonas schloesseri]|eukprot:KAG2443224.1 hypothetical protein HYH02_009297 [Chlamydomonas schloesseri]